MNDRLVGASDWEQDLYDHIASHEENEKELLVEYQQVIEECDSPAFRFLVSLIIEEGGRHHRLLRDLAQSLKADAGPQPCEPPIPRIGSWGTDPHRVADITDRLVAHEEADRQQLRQIARQMDPVKDTTLWELLIELMELDTAKHTLILNFIRRRARKAIR